MKVSLGNKSAALFQAGTTAVRAAMLSIGVATTSAWCDNKKQVEAYNFVIDPTERIIMQREGMQYLGKIDSAGNFLPDANRKAFPLGSPNFGSRPSGRLSNFPFRNTEENVFEFRADRLIPGKLDLQGNFIPSLEERIIPFKDYVFSSTARRIYNLPGKFVPAGQPKSINRSGQMILARIKPNTSMECVDDTLGAKTAHQRDADGRIRSYYYTEFDVIVEFDDKGSVTKAYCADISKK